MYIVYKTEYKFKRHVVAITGLYSRTKLLFTQPEIQATFFITEPGKWPPNSPDLNLVNYAILVALQEQLVYLLRKFTTVEQLKFAIITELRNLSQRFIDRSINEFRQRLENVEKQRTH